MAVLDPTRAFWLLDNLQAAGTVTPVSAMAYLQVTLNLSKLDAKQLVTTWLTQRGAI